MHLSMLPQQVRYGFFGSIDVAIVEAVDVTPGGAVVLSAGVGAANTYLRMAKKILIEVNAHHPQALRATSGLLVISCGRKRIRLWKISRLS